MSFRQPRAVLCLLVSALPAIAQQPGGLPARVARGCASCAASGCGVTFPGVRLRPRSATQSEQMRALAFNMRSEIRAEMRNTRIYSDLMSDANAALRAIDRLNQAELSGSAEEMFEATQTALAPLRRMYSAIRNDPLASRSQASVRALGRQLLSLSRSLSDQLPSSPTGEGELQLTIPAEMKGVRLLPMQQRTVALRQRICPVTEQPLGSMGKPILVRVAGREVYVCCEGCIETLRNSPEEYLTRLGARQPGRRVPERSSRPVSIPETMKGLRLLPLNEQRVAMRQRTCPVMGSLLGSMGQPIKVTVNGRSTYVCCQGCVASVQQNPARYLR